MDMKQIDLEWLLDYELQAAERYRRYLTLVMVDTDYCPSYLEKIFAATLRECDAVTSSGQSISIIMSDTRTNGALQVIERLKRECEENKRNYYSVVSYPQDGSDTDSLISKGQGRLENARGIAPGTAIYSD